jgi:hypothetical protein
VSDIRCAKFGCVLGSKYMTPHTLPAQMVCWQLHAEKDTEHTEPTPSVKQLPMRKSKNLAR